MIRASADVMTHHIERGPMPEEQRAQLAALLRMPDPPEMQGRFARRGHRYRFGAKFPDRRSDMKVELEQLWLLNRDGVAHESVIVSVQRHPRS